MMRILFFILFIYLGISSKSQTSDWYNDTLNGARTRYQYWLKTVEQLPDSIILMVSPLISVRVSKNILTPSQGGGISQQTLNDTADAIRTTVNSKQPTITLGTTAQYFRGDLSLATFPTTTAAFSNSTNKNFVTDADITKLGNLSGTNSGDNATNSQYSGLAASKENTVSAGTTSQYYRGDKTWQNYGGYTINVQALTSSPADGQTIYFGTLPKAPITTAGNSKIYIREAGTIVAAEIYCFSGTAGSNENWSISIRRNNTTDFLIATVGASTSERVFSNTGLSIAIAAGDYIEIKAVNPTWATNPLTTIFGGYIRIK